MTDKYEALRAAIDGLAAETEISSRIPWFSIEQPLFEKFTGEFGSELSRLPETNMRFLSEANPDAVHALLVGHDGLLEQHRRDSKKLREYVRERDALRKERNALREAIAEYLRAQDAFDNNEYQSMPESYGTLNGHRKDARDDLDSVLAQHKEERHG